MRTTTRGVLVNLGVLVAIVLLIPLLGGGMMGAGMMHGYGPPGPGAWSGSMGMGLGWLMMLAFWGIVVLGVALLVGWFASNRGTPAAGSALEVLRRRFAAGELTPEQFDQMRQALKGTG